VELTRCDVGALPTTLHPEFLRYYFDRHKATKIIDTPKLQDYRIQTAISLIISPETF